MARDYLDILNVDESVQNKVHQRLKFRTGKFVWKVKFNIPLDPRTVNNNNLYVMTTNDIPCLPISDITAKLMRSK